MKIETMQDLVDDLEEIDYIAAKNGDVSGFAQRIIQALQGKALVPEKDLQSTEYWKTQAMHLSDLAYKYEQALCRISHPVVAMQKDALEEGAILDGFMAQNLARDGHMLSEWARQALQASQEKDNE